MLFQKTITPQGRTKYCECDGECPGTFTGAYECKKVNGTVQYGDESWPNSPDTITFYDTPEGLAKGKVSFLTWWQKLDTFTL